MADIEFGDNELFQQLDDYEPRATKHIHFTNDEEDQEDKSKLRSRLEECDEYIERLTEENKNLRRKQNILTRPSNITIEDVNLDGPVLQILYANNAISKQCRQELEDCICNVILKHQKQRHENTKSAFQMKPQNSAFALDEDPQKSLTSSVRTTSEAFKVVGSVSYFMTFSLDKLGQPLVNENPQLTDGWDVPIYIQVFNQIVGTDGQEVEMKDKRPKSLCFNCGLSGHQLRDCPKPKDMAAINERRKEFNQNNNQAIQSNQRYHADKVEERFAKYKPGVMSVELLTALGIEYNTLPPLIYRMRQLGYPPGWLKEAEMENSGLTLYDGNVSNDDSKKDSLHDISYDVSKLIDFPGFNIPAPGKMKDEFINYGSVPMQPNHMKENYAAYLSSNYPTTSSTCNKRHRECDSSPQQKKRSRSSPNDSSDMDIESDPGIPYPPDFHFQPPFPPGSPCFSSPPPLPQGTPPATPTPPPLPKGTPPLTPTNGSPATRGRNWVEGDEAVGGTEDDLTLEELEEQQRMIWAALEKAETGNNSDCENPGMGTPAISSPSPSTPTHVDTKMEEETMGTLKPAESYDTCANQKESVAQEVLSHHLEMTKQQEDSPQSPEPVNKQEDKPQSPGPDKVKDDSPQSPDPIKSQEDRPQSPVPDSGVTGDCASPEHLEKITAVPHRSNFAAGIVPFEDTPEFTEVAASTGTYLKIRDLLKSSPRNLIRKS
ncbi:zinc finger CCHC domain-containing protein 8 [Antennarius striatus]|uniref:zinc finger CCHC domain-containing protein 8 n=1 Tax=Antennarius striatus TaxID=241820 RepID=UPI0035B22329